jgi:crotonobetainyl-CoA:carnitine CoA-transferase CaiB-like acyl-CoA transferase
MRAVERKVMIGPSRVMGGGYMPMKLSETPGAVDRAAPLLGQNTEQILIELGTGAYSLSN